MYPFFCVVLTLTLFSHHVPPRACCHRLVVSSLPLAVCLSIHLCWLNGYQILPPHPSFLSKLFIWVNSPLVGVLYLHFISSPSSLPLFSLTSYPIPSPHCPPSPTAIIATMRSILPASHHLCRTIRRSTWSTYTAGLTACAPRTKAPTSSSPPLPPI